MNRNTTAVILIVLAVGIYFTFTREKIDELKALYATNQEYEQAIENSERLIKVRDEVIRAYNNISEGDKERLNKIVPDHVDNVRLMIDIKDDIAASNGLFLKNLKTSSAGSGESSGKSLGEGESLPVASGGDKYGVVTVSFSVSATYNQFRELLRDIESSLRIMDVSRLTISGNDQGTYDFGVEIKTYWLKQ